MSSQGPPKTSQNALSQAASRAPIGGLRFPSNKKTIYDRNLNRTRNAELSRAAFAYLFVEMISYAQKRVTGIADLEKRYAFAADTGRPPLTRPLPGSTRQATRSGSSCWTFCCRGRRRSRRCSGRRACCRCCSSSRPRSGGTCSGGRPTRSSAAPPTPPSTWSRTTSRSLTSTISVPREMSQLNCAAFVAGIIEGVCDGAGFATNGVSAHWAGEGGEADAKGMWPGKTVFLIRFREDVLEREEILGRGAS